MYKRNIKAYTASNLAADLATADPHRVIQLMMQGCLERLAQAKGAIERQDMEANRWPFPRHKGCCMVCRMHWI